MHLINRDVGDSFLSSWLPARRSAIFAFGFAFAAFGFPFSFGSVMLTLAFSFAFSFASAFPAFCRSSDSVVGYCLGRS